MWGTNGVDGFTGDADRGAHQQQRGCSRRERFGFAMTVGMVVVGRPRGDREPTPHHKRSNNVSRGFDRVRNESVAMTKNTGDELHAGEHRIDEHAELRGARADVRGVGRLGWSQCVVGR